MSGDPNITRVFPNVAAARNWAKAVVGEREVRTCANCEKLKTTVGQGLRYQFRVEREIVAADLAAIMSQPMNYRITSAELNKLSAPGMGVVINDSTIHNLKRAPIGVDFIRCDMGAPSEHRHGVNSIHRRHY